MGRYRITFMEHREEGCDGEERSCGGKTGKGDNKSGCAVVGPGFGPTPWVGQGEKDGGAKNHALSSMGWARRGNRVAALSAYCLGRGQAVCSQTLLLHH